MNLLLFRSLAVLTAIRVGVPIAILRLVKDSLAYNYHTIYLNTKMVQREFINQMLIKTSRIRIVFASLEGNS